MNINPGMKTVVSSGSSQARTSTEKNPLSKDPANITSSTGQSTQEAFTLSEPTLADPGAALRAASLRGGQIAPSGFGALSSEDKSQVKKIMKDLNTNARLFARNDDGQLVRITPAHGKERLDGGQAVEVVTRLGTETSSSRSSSTEKHTKTKFWSAPNRKQKNASSSKSTVQANYSSSPLSDWDSLLWHDDESDIKGIPGTATLPPSGQAVTLSSEFESKWSKSSETHSGFLGRIADSSRDSGYTKVERSAN